MGGKVRKLIRLSTLVLFIFGLVSHSGAQSSTPRTCWGWIKGHSEIDGGTVKAIRGKVVDPNEEAIPGALIEVFAYTDADLDKRIRVAYRLVGSNGYFSFSGLRPGKYELRGSYCHGAGFDAGHTIVTLRPNRKSASSKRVLVTLNLSH
jgi:hypothetical protein